MFVILLFIVCIFFPLSLLGQLKMMRYTTFLGNASVVWYLLLCILRTLDGSYLPGGTFASTPGVALATTVAPSPLAVGSAAGICQLFMRCCLACNIQYTIAK